MGHPPIEKLLPNAGWSIYKLSRLAAIRAAELASGKKPLVATETRTKTATIALEEIAATMVVLKDALKTIKPLPQEEASVSSEDEAAEI